MLKMSYVSKSIQNYDLRSSIWLKILLKGSTRWMNEQKLAKNRNSNLRRPTLSKEDMNQALTSVRMQKSLKSFSFLSIQNQKVHLTNAFTTTLKGRRRRRRIFRQIRTFQSPALGPATIPSSMTSMQTNGCLRFGACFRTCALANLSISLASPRDSNLSVLWRLATQGLLRSRISRAHRRAVLTNSLGETRASTRPKRKASSPLTGFDVYMNTLRGSLKKLTR